jgi:hypothetical protein
MDKEDSFSEKESDNIFAVSGVYLLIIGIVGGSLNVVALVRAFRVSILISSMKRRNKG